MIEDCSEITNLYDYWTALATVLFLAGMAVWFAYGAGKQAEKNKWNKQLMDRHYADQEKVKMEGDGT